jgi:hypothetical protein
VAEGEEDDDWNNAVPQATTFYRLLLLQNPAEPDAFDFGGSNKSGN